jgi:hypothetical protein
MTIIQSQDILFPTAIMRSLDILFPTVAAAVVKEDPHSLWASVHSPLNQRVRLE